jgi:putative transposase
LDADHPSIGVNLPRRITIENITSYRTWEQKLAVAQRARSKKRVRAIHKKIRNCRRDHHHKATARIARENSFIAVGDVNSAKLARTRMAKSVLDAGWSEFRNMLDYKARRHRAHFEIVNESFTTQTCSCCGGIPDSSPKGMGALGMREWICSECGARHDRDVNSAKNILVLALSAQRPVGES